MVGDVWKEASWAGGSGSHARSTVHKGGAEKRSTKSSGAGDSAREAGESREGGRPGRMAQGVQKGVFPSSLSVFDPGRLFHAGSDVCNKDEHLLSFEHQIIIHSFSKY